MTTEAMATEQMNGNGIEESIETSTALVRSEHYQTLLTAGLPRKVADKLDDIYLAGMDCRPSKVFHVLPGNVSS